METIGKVTVFGQECDVVLAGRYTDGTRRLDLVIAPTGEPMATLTTCVPGTDLGIDEYLVKTWSENEPVAKACRELFADTGRRVSTGYVQAQVWRWLS